MLLISRGCAFALGGIRRHHVALLHTLVAIIAVVVVYFVFRGRD